MRRTVSLPAEAAYDRAGRSMFLLVLGRQRPSGVSDPQGAGTFSKMEWRIAEKTALGGGTEQIFAAGQEWAYMDDGQAPDPATPNS